MAKRPLKLSVRIPNVMQDRKEWRRSINAAICEAQATSPVRYGPEDTLEVRIRFYLRDRKLTILDVDNRVKDVLDALQGLMGDKGKKRLRTTIIPNDNQIYRINRGEATASEGRQRSVEHHRVIRKYTNHRKTARTPREHRKQAGPCERKRTPTRLTK